CWLSIVTISGFSASLSRCVFFLFAMGLSCCGRVANRATLATLVPRPAAWFGARHYDNRVMFALAQPTSTPSQRRSETFGNKRLAITRNYDTDVISMTLVSYSGVRAWQCRSWRERATPLWQRTSNIGAKLAVLWSRRFP